MSPQHLVIGAKLQHPTVYNGHISAKPTTWTGFGISGCWKCLTVIKSNKISLFCTHCSWSTTSHRSKLYTLHSCSPAKGFNAAFPWFISFSSNRRCQQAGSVGSAGVLIAPCFLHIYNHFWLPREMLWVFFLSKLTNAQIIPSCFFLFRIFQPSNRI